MSTRKHWRGPRRWTRPGWRSAGHLRPSGRGRRSISPGSPPRRACIRSRGGGGGRLRTGRGKHHAREQGRSALDQGVRSLDQGRDRSLRLSVRETLTGPGADFMSTSPMGANKPIEDIEATLHAATKSVWMSSSGGPTRRWQRKPRGPVIPTFANVLTPKGARMLESDNLLSEEFRPVVNFWNRRTTGTPD